MYIYIYIYIFICSEKYFTHLWYRTINPTIQIKHITHNENKIVYDNNKNNDDDNDNNDEEVVRGN